MARIASLRAGIPVTASAVTGQQILAHPVASHRFCSRAGNVWLVVGRRRRRDRINEPRTPWEATRSRRIRLWSISTPDVYLTTGLVAENHALRIRHLPRDEQDAFALRSHQRAVAAIDAGRFADEIVAVTARLLEASGRRDTSGI